MNLIYFSYILIINSTFAFNPNIIFKNKFNASLIKETNITFWITSSKSKYDPYYYQENTNNLISESSKYIQISSTLFLFAGLIQIYRAINELPLTILGFDVPILLSYVVGSCILFLGYSGYLLSVSLNNNRIFF
jgi:hypothetical protein